MLRYGGTGDWSVQLSGVLRASAASLQPFASDRDGTMIAASPVETRFRLAPELRYAHFGLIGEVDVMAGALSGLPERALGLGPSAHPVVTPAELRQLYVEYRGDTFVVRAGQQTSRWGLG
ncbi:MAG: hypothetical protein IRZ16_23540, partial [Myxococcaceae bacterium]|nr:hypothetical protein [Myxococcaceae bacterium]